MMKWWGWGDSNMTFPMASKPDLWPWVKQKLGIEIERLTKPVERSSIKLPEPTINHPFVSELICFLSAEQISFGDDDRLLHTYGKSYPNLLKVRRGQIDKAPDLVVYPESHEQVEALLKSADRFGVVVIPFGGGTNIVGGIDPRAIERRTIVTVDLSLMNKVLSIDSYSMVATIQAGILGPKLELELQSQGYSLGHSPDSFEYSTLGGWLATRSAGMQSDAYGRIEDMAVAIKMVTPIGTIETREVPATSAGPNLNQIIMGSEGVLGIITEAKMRIHKTPKVKSYSGFLFPTFDDGISAIHECIRSGFSPSLVRLQDSGETEFAFHMKARKTGWKKWIQRPIKAYLKAKGYTHPCILVVGFEGDKTPVRLTRKHALSILKKHKGFPLGASVGQSWSQDKFNIPYLRDFVMDYGCMADVAETSATWSNVLPLYENTIKACQQKFSENGGFGYIGCHISHTYETGACLYFTYAATQEPDNELGQYYEYKKFITDTFMKNGGTVSHHHAIGYEHLPWMKEEVSPAGIKTLQSVKSTLDPQGILNPGKLIPSKLASHEYLEESFVDPVKLEKIALASNSE